MTKIDETKRLKDDELEAVAGGVTATSMDPTAYHYDIQGYNPGHYSALNLTSVLPGGPTPVHTNQDPLHTDLNSMPTAAAGLTHAPAGGGGAHPTDPTLTGAGSPPIKR